MRRAAVLVALVVGCGGSVARELGEGGSGGDGGAVGGTGGQGGGDCLLAPPGDWQLCYVMGVQPGDAQLWVDCDAAPFVHCWQQAASDAPREWCCPNTY